MADTDERVLVYSRIASNKRKTRWLIGSFALTLLPVVTAFSVLLLPFVATIGAAAAYLIYGPALRGKIDALDARITASTAVARPIGLPDLPLPVLVLIGALLAVALIAVLMVFCAGTAVFISRYGSRMLLRAAHARPIDRGAERDLVRVVENLCIGAGLPEPALHIVESAAPNAFATGRDPAHASLVVTRGLMTLLDRRELEGVIAHELSHIGNHDIKLTTTLAAVVTVATAPFRMIAAGFRFAFGIHWAIGGLASWFALAFCVSFFHVVLALATMPRDDQSLRAMPMFVRWWSLHATIAPAYAIFIAPVFGMLIRRAVSREREFLADADAALLTRDPEGLALALVKIGGARGERLRVGEGSVHLYFVDPLHEVRSWLHYLFPSHPPLSARIEMLERMGSGIQPSALDAALKAAERHAELQTATAVSVQSESSQPNDAPPDPRWEPEIVQAPKVSAADGKLTPLYEKADGWSRVLARLSPDARVTPIAREGNFVRVQTDNGVGYVPHTAPFGSIKSSG